MLFTMREFGVNIGKNVGHFPKYIKSQILRLQIPIVLAVNLSEI